MRRLQTCRVAWVAQPQGWIVTADALNTQKGKDHKIRDQTASDILPVKRSHPYLQVQFSGVFEVILPGAVFLIPISTAETKEHARRQLEARLGRDVPAWLTGLD